MNSKQVIVASVAVVFLACAVSVSLADCAPDVQQSAILEALRCKQLYDGATSGGAEIGCGAIGDIAECIDNVRNMHCDSITIKEDSEIYRNVMSRKAACGGAPRLSIGFVLIVVTLMSIFVTVTRY